MAKQKTPPSRQRYEEANPSLTVRVPAAVKTRVGELARAQGLSVSEWVQAAAAGHEADPVEAYRRGRGEGYAEGERAGQAEGRRAGIAVGAQAGLRVGILLDCLAREGGRSYHAPTVAKSLLADVEQVQIALAAATEFGKEVEFRRYLNRLAKPGR